MAKVSTIGPDSVEGSAAKYRGSFYDQILDTRTFPSEFSVNFWIKSPEVLGGPCRVVWFEAPLIANDFYIDIVSGTELDIAGHTFTISSSDLLDGAWHYIAVWRANGEIYLKLDDSTENFTPIADVRDFGGNRVLIGIYSADRFSRMDLSCLRIRDRKLTRFITKSAYDDMIGNFGNYTEPPGANG